MHFVKKRIIRKINNFKTTSVLKIEIGYLVFPNEDIHEVDMLLVLNLGKTSKDVMPFYSLRQKIIDPSLVLQEAYIGNADKIFDSANEIKNKADTISVS